jgi:hypothetical protein
MRTATNAALQGTQVAYFNYVSDSKDFQFSEPIMIPPNYGFGVAIGTVNTNLYTTIQWTEEAV